MFGTRKKRSPLRLKAAGQKAPRRRGRRTPSKAAKLVLPLMLVAAAGVVSLFTAPGTATDAQPASTNLVSLATRAMPICSGGKRITCVVDGDTFWISGEKVRLESIDAPEVNGACKHERELAQRATRRLSELLGGEIKLARNGKDRYGRTLARVHTAGGEAGAILVSEGFAQVWKGRKAQWCAGPNAASG